MSIISLFLPLLRQPRVDSLHGDAGRIQRRMSLLHIFRQQESMACIRDKVQLCFHAAGVQQVMKLQRMEGEYNAVLLPVQKQCRAGLRGDVRRWGKQRDLFRRAFFFQQRMRGTCRDMFSPARIGKIGDGVDQNSGLEECWSFHDGMKDGSEKYSLSVISAAAR